MGARVEPRRIGRYALYSEIAAGGMATVHIGRLLGPVGFSRTVAIKRLHSVYARDPEFVSMFLDEARLAARIRHPHVVPTIDVVATGGELFVVMEYIQGESLSQIARRLRANDQRMPPRIVVSIMSGVLRGLHAAHEAKDERGMHLGIVHRDVSPQNIMVGSDGLARVLDFGIAKASVRLGTTRDGQIKGKLSYMAPEQLRADAVSPSADIYAASVVLWELLTGKKLFQGDTEAIVLARVLEGEISPPSTVAADIPKEFDAVTLKGLAKVASGRYLSGRDMALDLERCAGTASAAEVAAWLELTVGDTLSNRATTVAGIEADSGTLTDVADALSELSLRGPTTLDEPIPVDVSSSAPPPQVGAPTMPLEFRVPRTPFEARVTLPEESTSAQNSAVSLARDLPFPRTSRRWRGLALGAAAVLGVTIVAIAVARRAPAAPAVAPQAVVAASEQGVAPPPPTVAAVAAAADSSITTNTVSRPSSPPSASAPPSPRPIVRATAAARPDVRPPAASPHPASKSAFDGLGERQ